MKIPGISDLLNRDRDDDEFDDEFEDDVEDSDNDQVMRKTRSQGKAGNRKGKRSGVGSMKMPKSKNGEDFILPNVAAVLQDDETPDVTADQARNVKFNVSKPQGYYFPQVEAYSQSVSNSLEWYDNKLLKAKQALFDLQEEADAQMEQIQDLRIQIEAFKVQGQAVVNADGTYYMESQQKAENELNRIQSMYDDEVRSRTALEREMQALQQEIQNNRGNAADSQKIQDLEKYNNELVGALSQWEQRDATQEEYIDELTIKNEQLSAKNEQLSAKNDELKAKIEEWEEYAESLENSSSETDESAEENVSSIIHTLGDTDIDTETYANEDHSTEVAESYVDIVEDDNDNSADDAIDDIQGDDVSGSEEIETEHLDVEDASPEQGEYPENVEYTEPHDDGNVVDGELEEDEEQQAYVENDADGELDTPESFNLVKPEDDVQNGDVVDSGGSSSVEDTTNYNTEDSSDSIESGSTYIVDEVEPEDEGAQEIDDVEEYTEGEEDSINYTYKNDVEGAPLSHNWSPEEDAQWAALFAPKRHDDD